MMSEEEMDMEFGPEMMEEEPMEGDVYAQLDQLAMDYPKAKKEIDSLKKKLESEMGEMPEDEEFDEEEMMSEDLDDEEMDYEDEDLDSILG